MKTLWGKFLCRVWFRKHKRRRRKHEPLGRGDFLECPRCGAWAYSAPGIAPKPAEPAIPASIRK